MDGRTIDNILFAAIVLAAVVVILFTGRASGHEWYPLECCSATDCAPVESTQLINPIEASGLPSLLVTSKVGTTIIPKTAQWRMSKDNRMHVCIKSYDKNPATNFLCVFAPPTM